MPIHERTREGASPPGIDLQEEDICEAMQKIPGYLDITPGDFKEIYLMAYQQALTRLECRVRAGDIVTRGWWR